MTRWLAPLRADEARAAFGICQAARCKVKRPHEFLWFVLFIWLIWFIWLVSFNQKTKQTRQTKQTQ